MSELEQLREENRRLREAVAPFARAAAYALQGNYSAIADEERIGLGWTDDDREDGVPLLTVAEVFAIAQFNEPAE